MSAATTYGCTYEKEAIETYKSRMIGHSGLLSNHVASLLTKNLHS